MNRLILAFFAAVLAVCVTTTSSFAQGGLDNGSTSIQVECPNELLFNVGNFYYYSSMVCEGTSSPSTVLIYSSIVPTGCENGLCKAGPPYAQIDEPQPVGTGNPMAMQSTAPTTTTNSYAAVTNEAQLMVPYGSPAKFSGYVGYPKYLTADMGADGKKYFKVYRMVIGGKSKAIGVEVTAVPAGTTAQQQLTFNSFGANDGRLLKINVRDGFENFDANLLFAMPKK